MSLPFTVFGSFLTFSIPTLTVSIPLSVFLHQPFETYSVRVMVLLSARKHVAMSECDTDILVVSKELGNALVFGWFMCLSLALHGMVLLCSSKERWISGLGYIKDNRREAFSTISYDPSHSFCLSKALCLFVCPLTVSLCGSFCLSGISFLWAEHIC